MPASIIIASGRTFRVAQYMHMGATWFVAFDKINSTQSQAYGMVQQAARWLVNRGHE